MAEKSLSDELKNTKTTNKIVSLLSLLYFPRLCFSEENMKANKTYVTYVIKGVRGFTKKFPEMTNCFKALVRIKVTLQLFIKRFICLLTKCILGAYMAIQHKENEKHV